MTDIVANLEQVNARVLAAAKAAGRSPHSVMLLAVSKTFDANAVWTAVQAGQRAFGESYLQEALPKIEAVSALAAQHRLPQPIEWHYIGPMQSNKTRQIATAFEWVHSVDREKIAQRLNDGRSAELPPLNVCVQVNISGEPTKSGVSGDGLGALIACIAHLPRLRLRGLMAIPRDTPDPGQQRAQFYEVRKLYEAHVARGVPLDTLSMGMSDDMEAAIFEGATIVRVGRAIFGERG